MKFRVNHFDFFTFSPLKIYYCGHIAIPVANSVAISVVKSSPNSVAKLGVHSKCFLVSVDDDIDIENSELLKTSF